VVVEELVFLRAPSFSARGVEVFFQGDRSTARGQGESTKRIRKNVNFGEVKGKCPSMNIAAGLAAAHQRFGRAWEPEAIPSSVSIVATGEWKRFFRFPTL
jgi:hypothetical protein